jgi:hypothetical protein
MLRRILVPALMAGAAALACHAHDPGPPAPVTGPAASPAPAAQASATMSEPERLLLLRMQVGYLDREAPYGNIPAPAEFEAFSKGAAIDAARLDDARARWQAERERDADEASFFWLTRHLAEAYDQAAREADASLVEEGALSRLKDAGYRQFLSCRLARRAANRSDLVGAYRWLAEVDAHPMDINLDSELRMARVARAFAENDWDGALTALGRSRDEVPFASRWAVNAAVKRAHALEKLGELGLASGELAYWMRGPRDRALVMRVAPSSFGQQIDRMVALHHYATDSYALAKVRLRAPRRATPTGT